ncbi:hypothetical protein A8709_10385 [Paenibacillus pectinilyticus]|uniref:DUF1453 domain-containing protein n=1 Tax=Paenibacillus pectinilyticus TaxID=512399 RepID=A0A1C1A626_9BACL|nr:hypothetical protein [Paenibacillus pectinilyticus]OCT16016.1 hypothetical protein A8709_10385 [Paenibacillus pectinilyticus]
MNTTTWIEILLIMAIAMWTQMGRRAFTTRRIFMPFIVSIIMGQQYLHGIPMSGSNLGALGLCLLVGIVFGGLLLAATTVERDASGVVYTKAGLPYLVIWVLELGSRVAFAYYARSHQQQVGHFLLSHHLSPDVIGSGFMLMTIAMLLTRVLGIVVWGKWVRTSRKAVM